MKKNSDLGNVATWIVVILAVIAATAKQVVKLTNDAAGRIKFKMLMAPIAKDEQGRSKIHPDITITQAAHESAWGSSGLTVRANNLFGFTGEAWEKAGKPVIKLPTTEYIKGVKTTVLRPFRAYTSWAASVRDWATLISTQPRYRLAYQAAVDGDVNRFAKEVAQAGYATDPSYASKLVQVATAVRNTPSNDAAA